MIASDSVEITKAALAVKMIAINKYLQFHCSLFKLSLQVMLSAMFFHRNSQASIKMVTHNIFGSIHLWLVQIRVKPSYHWDALILLKQDTSKSSFSMLVRYRKIHWIILPQICWRYPTFICVTGLWFRIVGWRKLHSIHLKRKWLENAVSAWNWKGNNANRLEILQIGCS